MTKFNLLIQIQIINSIPTAISADWDRIDSATTQARTDYYKHLRELLVSRLQT